MCLMQSLFRNSVNSLLVKHAPLSGTIVSGNPNHANIALSFRIVHSDVATSTTSASIHFE